MDNIEFKVLGTGEVKDILQHYKNLSDKFFAIDVYVSTDSQARGDQLIYATVVAFHCFDALFRGKGASVLYNKFKLDRHLYGKAAREDGNKLYTETLKSLEVAKYLRDKLDIPVNMIELDYNPDEKYFSNKFLLSSINEVEANGFHAKGKPAYVTYAADKLSKK